ncbi:hypothetical protein ACKX2L_07685 [Lachnospiraceae bacterium YH-ros2228]
MENHIFYFIPLLFALEAIMGFDGIRWAYVAADMMSVGIAIALFVIGWKKMVQKDTVIDLSKEEKMAS